MSLFERLPFLRKVIFFYCTKISYLVDKTEDLYYHYIDMLYAKKGGV